MTGTIANNDYFSLTQKPIQTGLCPMIYLNQFLSYVKWSPPPPQHILMHVSFPQVRPLAALVVTSPAPTP